MMSVVPSRTVALSVSVELVAVAMHLRPHPNHVTDFSAYSPEWDSPVERRLRGRVRDSRLEAAVAA